MEDDGHTKTFRSPGHSGSYLGEGKHGPNWDYKDLIPLSVAEHHGCDHYEANHESDYPYPYNEDT